MTIAGTHGKISSTGRNLHDQMEDLLTSAVFSACKYLRPSTLFLPFIASAESQSGDNPPRILAKSAVQTKYNFWPWLAHGEPDLSVAIRDKSGELHLVMVEPKYFSGKSSAALDEDDVELAMAPSDQLAAEYEDLLTLERQLRLGESR